MKDLIRRQNVQLVLVQESKLRGMSDVIARLFYGMLARVRCWTAGGVHFSLSMVIRDEEKGYQWMLVDRCFTLEGGIFGMN